MATVSQEIAYDDAMQEFRVASQQYRRWAQLYRARQIDDDAFLSARKAFEAAGAKVDAAESMLGDNP